MNARREFLTKAALVSVATIAAAGGVTRLARSDHVVVNGMRRAARRSYPNVVLRNQDNRPLRFYDDIIRNRVVVINMAYAECQGVCPLAARNLKRVHQAMRDRVGRAFSMYTLSLNPLRDTPERLKAQMQRDGIPGDGWQFLTGAVDDVEQVRRRMGFVDVDPLLDADKREHTGLVSIGNDRYDWWCMTPALATPQTLVTAIDRMLKYA